MEMEELIRQAVRTGPVVVEDPKESNPLFKERMREYKEKLIEPEEQRIEEKGIKA